MAETSAGREHGQGKEILSFQRPTSKSVVKNLNRADPIGADREGVMKRAIGSVVVNPESWQD
jgi:hypothetical protein